MNGRRFTSLLLAGSLMLYGCSSTGPERCENQMEGSQNISYLDLDLLVWEDFEVLDEENGVRLNIGVPGEEYPLMVVSSDIRTYSDSSEFPQEEDEIRNYITDWMDDHVDGSWEILSASCTPIWLNDEECMQIDWTYRKDGLFSWFSPEQTGTMIAASSDERTYQLVICASSEDFPYYPMDQLANQIDIKTIKGKELGRKLDAIQSRFDRLDVPSWPTDEEKKQYDEAVKSYQAAYKNKDLDACRESIDDINSLNEASRTRITELSSSLSKISVHEYASDEEKKTFTSLQKNAQSDFESGSYDKAKSSMQEMTDLNKTISSRLDTDYTKACDEIKAISVSEYATDTEKKEFEDSKTKALDEAKKSAAGIAALTAAADSLNTINKTANTRHEEEEAKKKAEEEAKAKAEAEAKAKAEAEAKAKAEAEAKAKAEAEAKAQAEAQAKAAEEAAKAAAAAQTVTEDTVTYIVNTNTGKFHRTTCRDVSKIAAHNRWDCTLSRAEIVAQGYVPCKHCNP